MGHCNWEGTVVSMGGSGSLIFAHERQKRLLLKRIRWAAVEKRPVGIATSLTSAIFSRILGQFLMLCLSDMHNLRILCLNIIHHCPTAVSFIRELRTVVVCYCSFPFFDAPCTFRCGRLDLVWSVGMVMS